MEVREAWIKASVEHWILRIKYLSRKKGEITQREIEPDFIGYSRDGKNYGYWAAYDYLRRDSPRCFKPENIMEWNVSKRKFDFSSFSSVRRWRELIPLYESLNLNNKPWPSEKVID
ncbi:MAG: hypothetical protein ACFFAU_20645 [Candidatus Hodarchaeota archaeon]